MFCYRPTLMWSLVFFGLSLAPWVAHAHTPKTFLWAEADGTVHISTRIQDVAEPFFSIYKAQEAAGTQGRDAGSNIATGMEQDRALWRQRLANARAALLAATGAWAAVQQQDWALTQNPVLRLTPAVQAKREALAPALAEAKARYFAARKYLLTGFVAEARRAQVPMGWLQ